MLESYKVHIFVFYCIVSNSCTVGYVCVFSGDHVFMYFVSFLSMIIFEVLYTLTFAVPGFKI